MLPNVPPVLCSGRSTEQQAHQQVLYSRVGLVRLHTQHAHAQRRGADPRSRPVNLPPICRDPAGRHADTVRVQSLKQLCASFSNSVPPVGDAEGIQCSGQTFQANVGGKHDQRQGANKQTSQVERSSTRVSIEHLQHGMPDRDTLNVPKTAN